MKAKLFLYIALFSLITSTYGIEYSEQFRTTYEPSYNQEGYSIQINGRWELKTYLGEPLQNIIFKWDFLDSETITMQFIPFGSIGMKEVEVPIEIAKKSRPINVKFKAKLSSIPRGYIIFDGGASGRDTNYNVTGSPDWDRLIMLDDKYIDEERAIEAVLDELNLNFSYFQHQISFTLADIKLWYDKSQREAVRTKTCTNLRQLYSELSEISGQYKARLKKVSDLCSNQGKVSIERLKKEFRRAQNTYFKAPELNGQQTVEINKQISSKLNQLEEELNSISIPNVSEEEIEKIYNSAKAAEEREIKLVKEKERENSRRKIKATMKNLQGLIDGHEFDDGYENLSSIYKFTALTNCAARVYFRFFTQGRVSLIYKGIVDLRKSTRIESGSIIFSGDFTVTTGTSDEERSEFIMNTLLHSKDTEKSEREKKIMKAAKDVINSCKGRMTTKTGIY